MRRLPWKSGLTLLLRAGITLFAFWWIFRKVDLAIVRQTLGSADHFWLAVTVAVFFLSQAGCILRWSVLVPPHPRLNLPFLANSFWVASFFNTFLPTTVGGDVIRGWDLIKTTGEWRGSLASVLVDRLLGLIGFLTFALIAWVSLPTAREDPMIRTGFAGFCLLVALTFCVLGSRRILQGLLRPFAKIGLGQLQSHAKQFQETLRDYVGRPARILKGLAVTAVIQLLAIFIYAAAARALHLFIPLTYLILVVPMILTISQVPVSLNGWGIREWATVLFLGRIGVSGHEALSLSLICGLVPLLSGMMGAVLFLVRQKRKKKPEISAPT